METPALEAITRLLRYHILTITHRAGSGHPTSSFSAVELATVLFFKYLRFDLDRPENPANDRVIFSKGHASALLYSLYAVAGKISEKELLTYRDFGSCLEGHPTKRFVYAEAATGSLGQGLSIGAGEAYALHHQDLGGPYTMPRVYVLLGDGELAEGAVWEAAAWASKNKLHNLIAIVDVNGFGQSQETMYGRDTDVYRRRFDAFGWATTMIDGHDLSQIDAAYQKALMYRHGPVAIIAKTIKGKGIPYWEDQNGWHNKMLPKEELAKALALYKPKGKAIVGVIQKPEQDARGDENFLAPLLASSGTIQYPIRLRFGEGSHPSTAKLGKRSAKILSPLAYDSKELVATKKAFGDAIVALAPTHSELMVLDGDVANSLHTEAFAKAYPAQFLQMYIAEQNMVGVAVGLARRGYTPFVTTFSCFLTRAHDQIRMAPLSGVTVLFNGSYAGVSLGKDGPSQMGLEDIALFRAVAGSTVLYPSDAVSAYRLTETMLGLSGVVYLRTTREPTPVIYGADEKFLVGGSKVFLPKRSNEVTKLRTNATVAVVAAGITLHESLKAQQELAKEGIGVRVIDCYSVKPIDEKTLKTAARETKGVIVVEDHYPEGGLGEAVKSALSDSPRVPIIHLAVRRPPMSGTAAELLDYEGINAVDIAETIRSFLKTQK